MKEQLLHLTSLCIDKGLTLTMYPDLKNVQVYKIVNKQVSFNHCSYYDGNLINYKDETTLPLNELIKLVEDYEK